MIDKTWQLENTLAVIIYYANGVSGMLAEGSSNVTLTNLILKKEPHGFTSNEKRHRDYFTNTNSGLKIGKKVK